MAKNLPDPSGKRGSNSRGSGTLPDPTGGDFDPFFNAGVVGKLGTKGVMEVLGPPVENQTEFSDMQMPVSYKRAKYSMGLKVSSGNYARLFARFGNSPKKWRGKVNVEVKHFKANDYVAVV